MALEVKKAVCQFCHARCRIAVTSENGRLVKIEEDMSYPRAGGVLPPVKACLKLQAAKEWMYHPDRVNFPLRRQGERGAGKWDRISWDQALDEIATKLKNIVDTYGSEAVGITTGTGRMMDEFTGRFAHTLGTPNYVGAGNICFGPCMGVAMAMLGWTVRHRTALAVGSGAKGGTRCVLLLGINPAQAVPRLWKSLWEGKKLGLKVIVVDPRKTQTAEIADLWLQLRPGTDAALLLSMINVIIAEGLYDKDFVTKWCYGFDKLAERAREYPPQKVAEITWVAADKIIAAARMFATNRPALAVHGMGVEHLQNSAQAIQARFALGAIIGDVDREGGDYLPGPSRLIPCAEIDMGEKLSPEQKAKQLGSQRFKLLSWAGRDLMQPYIEKVWGAPCGIARLTAFGNAPLLWRAILTGEPYPVKALFTVASNPLLTPANTKVVYKALKNLELYVVNEFWLTPSAELADYVLPVASWLERPYLHDVQGHDCNITAGEKALPSEIPGEYEHKTDYEIFRSIALRMGLGEYFPWQSIEEVCDYRLKPMDMSFKDLMARGGFYFLPEEYRKYEKIGFGTPTGKVELYSTVLEKLGYDPLPRYEESFENPVSRPDLTKEYPLVLITGGRFHPMWHSEHRNIPSLRRRHPHPLLQVHPQTARELGIAQGEWVWLESPRGKIRMKCLYYDGIDPRVVHAEHGWWFPELPGEEPWLHGVWESNVNVLTDDDPEHCNRLSGGWPLKTALCRLTRIKEYK